MKTKNCTKCGNEKPLSEFYATKTRKGTETVYPSCKACCLEYQSRHAGRNSKTNVVYCNGVDAARLPHNVLIVVRKIARTLDGGELKVMHLKDHWQVLASKIFMEEKDADQAT